MLDTIIQAIQDRAVLRFTYDGLPRVVEPHAVGRSTTGSVLLRCYQTAGGHRRPGHDWDLCEVRKIVGLERTGDVFSNARPDYRRGDKAMTRIFAEL